MRNVIEHLLAAVIGGTVMIIMLICLLIEVL